MSIATTRMPWRRVAGALVIGGLIGVGLRLSGVYPMRIASASMAPAVHTGDLVVVVDVPAPRRHTLARGDIVLFRYPFGSEGRAIKRIVAIPGDTIAAWPRQLRVNGRVQEIVPVAGGGDGSVPEHVLPPDRYFILGDNSGASIDSRSLGHLGGEDIVGRVLLTVPLSKLWP